MTGKFADSKGFANATAGSLDAGSGGKPFAFLVSTTKQMIKVNVVTKLDI